MTYIRFNEYMPTDRPLEEYLQNIFDDLQVLPEVQNSINELLHPLKHRHTITCFHYEHSLRVGILSYQIAKLLKLDEKALLFSGLLHDVGKSTIGLDVLGKTGEWTDEDRKKMEPHVINGYKLLKGRFDFIAEIIIWHHKYQVNNYPKIMPPPLHDYGPETKEKIQFYGWVLALADSYDALHRISSGQHNDRGLSGDDIKKIMTENNHTHRDIVETLYDKGIFTTHLN